MVNSIIDDRVHTSTLRFMSNSFTDALVGGLRDAWCAALATYGNFLDALPDPLVDSGSVPIARLNRWLYRQYCAKEPPSAPPPPFTGGQCAFNYTVNTSWTRKARVAGSCVTTSVESGTNFLVMGPIKGLTTSRSGSNVSLQIVHGPSGASRTQVYTYADATACPAEFVTYSITSVTPSSGGADTCGNPPIVVPPPTPGYNNVSITINYSPSSGVSISLPVTFKFAPVRVNIRGEAYIPINVDIENAGIFVRGELNINTGDISFNFGNRNYGDNEGPQPDDYRPRDDIPDAPPDVPVDITDPLPTAPTTESATVLRAVIVTVSTVPSTISTIVQDDNPDIYAPNLGYVQFGISTKRKVAWTSDIPVKNKRNFIPCPWEGGAQVVRGTPRPGVVWQLTPVYLDVEKPVPLP